LLLACSFPACTTDKPEGNCNARDLPDKEFCFEYPKRSVDEGQKVCKDFGAKWSDGACDRSKALGACKLSSGVTKVFYSGTKFPSADAAKKECYDKWVGPDEK
jgi:hypothetical protein